MVPADILNKLDSDEKVLWKGKSEYLPFLLTTIFSPFSFVVLLFGGLEIPWVWGLFQKCLSVVGPDKYVYWGMFAIFTLPVAGYVFWLFFFVTLGFYNRFYVLTNKHFYCRFGIFKIRIRRFVVSCFSRVEIKNHLWDKVFHTQSVHFYTRKGYNMKTIYCLKNVSLVLSLFKQVAATQEMYASQVKMRKKRDLNADFWPDR